MEERLNMVHTLCSVVFASLLSQVLAQDLPSLSLTDSSGSLSFDSPVDKLYGDNLKFRCSPPAFDQTENFIILLHLQSESDDGSWELEGGCSYIDIDEGTKIQVKPSSLGVAEDNITCGANLEFADFSFSMPVTRRQAYRCRYSSVNDNEQEYSTTFTLKSHTKPDKPKIEPSTILVNEETSLTISCSSNGMPAPKLTILFQEEIVATSDAVEVTASSPLLQNNSVTWNINSVGPSYNGFPVTCAVTDHPYAGSVQSQVMFNVIYGPVSNGDGAEEKAYDIQSGDDLVIDGTMQGYPELEYKWFDSSNTTLATKAVLTVPQEKAKALSNSAQYRVVAKNPTTGDEAQLVYKIKLTDGTPTTEGTVGSPSGDASTGDKQGLKGWVIAIIAVVVVIALAVLIGVLVLWKYRKSPSSAKKSKAAQAKQSGDDRKDTTNYQSSMSSLAHQDMSRRTANYHENPTLPMEYRYSSQGDVEQYAEVIDDMPRSRKPIAVEEIDMFDAGDGPPMFEEAPPAYLDMQQPYRGDPNYSTYTSNNYGDSYGAAC